MKTITSLTPIQLIVGLGNPGPEYEATRHNVGAWFAQDIANQSNQILRLENKFKGLYARSNFKGHEFHLLLPITYMNLSGQAVAALVKFFKIPIASILAAHDDLDLPTGIVRLKFGGGHGGHNGLRDMIAHLGTPLFHRLRIGIGRPSQSKEVINYVLQPPSKTEKILIDQSIQEAFNLLPEILSGDMQKAMKALHTQNNVRSE